MPTPEYLELGMRISRLGSHFLNFSIPLDRPPDESERDRIASFKLLSHAEFEGFIESRIKSFISSSVLRWEESRELSRPILGLVVSWYPAFEKDKNPLSTPQGTEKIRDTLSRMKRKADDEIDQNNGIKKNGFLKMCYSAGIFSDEIDATLLAALDSYGKGRGDVAHRPISAVSSLNDPAVELHNAQQIHQLLLQFDELTS